MSDDGTIHDWLAMQQQVMPEWVGGAGKNAHYGPPDVGSQASQLNYVQDLMGTGVNPLMMWLAGQMDGGSLASTYEDDEVIPGVDEGRNYLTNVLSTSAPNSPEHLIADYIMNGGSPIEAVKLAQQKGVIQGGMKDVYKDGMKVGQEPDNSSIEYYTKWATDAQSKLLNDKAEQRTPGKEILHPFVQEMLNAGFTDPRQTYDTDYINPDLQRMDDKVEGQKAPLDAALKQRDAMSQMVQGQRQGPTPKPQAAPVDPETARHSGQAQPSWMGHQVGDPQMQELLQKPQAATYPHPDMGGMRFNAIPQNFDPMEAAHAAMQPFGSATDAANLFEARVAGGYKNEPNRGALAKRAEDVGRKAQQLNMGHARDKNTSSLSRIKSQAVSNHLQAQGRSPAMDQYQAAMQALLSRGIGR